MLPVFVENAFKHSLSSQSDKIRIHITIEIEKGGRLNFRCVNSYSGQSNTDSLPGGIGLKNVKKRLELIYPDAHELDIRKTEDTFDVALRIELL